MENSAGFNRNRQMFFNDWQEKKNCRKENFLVQLRKDKRNQINMRNREVFDVSEEKRLRISKIVHAAWEHKEKDHFHRFALKNLLDLFADSKSFIDFWNSGVFPLCLELLKTEDKLILVYCSELLADLTVADGIYCEEMVKAGIFKHFNELLSNKHQEILENTCWALNNIILESRENSVELINSEIFPKLLSLAFDESLTLHSRILFIFVNLCQYLRNDREKAENLMSIFIMYVKNDATFNTCLAGLAVLTENNKEFLSMLLEKCPVIIKKTSEKVFDACLNAARLLLNFSVFEMFTEELLNNKIIPISRNLIKSKEVRDRLIGFSMIKNLINSSEPHFSLVVADFSLLRSLADAILETNKDIKFEVWSSLKTLSNRLAFFHEDVYEVLLMHSATILGSEKNVDVFMCILETIEAILRNSGSFLNYVLGVMNELSMFDIISKNLHRKNSEISAKVEFLLNQYC